MTRALIGVLPNLVSVARLLAVPVVVWLCLSGLWRPAFWVFFAASASDGLDGFLARRLDAKTNLGAYLDAVADKVLLVSVYLVLGHSGHIPLWLVILVVSRDALIVGGVLLLNTLDQRPTLAPLLIGKVNTVMQLLLAGIVLADLAFDLVGEPIVSVLVWAAAATTFVSGGAYLVAWGRGLMRS